MLIIITVAVTAGIGIATIIIVVVIGRKLILRRHNRHRTHPESIQVSSLVFLVSKKCLDIFLILQFKILPKQQGPYKINSFISTNIASMETNPLYEAYQKTDIIEADA